MAKLNTKPITVFDIDKYLKEESNFSFEMEVIQELDKLKSCSQGFRLEHSGSYTDPITKKNREFDIRAYLSNNSGEKTNKLYMAIECKNLKDFYPLVIESMQRKREEDFHCLIEKNSPQLRNQKINIKRMNHPHPTVYWPYSVSVGGNQNIHSHVGHVGKSMNQLGVLDNGSLKCGDDKVYDKYTQALNSCFDFKQAIEADRAAHLSAILPILVVPDDTLWEVRYDEKMQVVSKDRVCHVQYYLDKKLFDDAGNPWNKFSISHLEIVTFSFLNSVIKLYFSGHQDQKIQNHQSGPNHKNNFAGINNDYKLF